MLQESITAILARNETWTGAAATEPYEAGWAREAVLFVRALKAPLGSMPHAVVEISPDGMHWVDEGTTIALPIEQDSLAVARVAHFGGWLRLRADIPDDSEIVVLVSVHLKA